MAAKTLKITKRKISARKNAPEAAEKNEPIILNVAGPR